MDLIFDISEDEVPIFMAEADEQLQMLDEGLVRLERAEQDADLLQALFRAAHTLKGASGMIGHKRMVELTHTLEAAFDGLRKDVLEISVPLIDTCLEAVDLLRMLTAEIVGSGPAQVDINPVVTRLAAFNVAAGGEKTSRTLPNEASGAPGDHGKVLSDPPETTQAAQPRGRKPSRRARSRKTPANPLTLRVEAEIASNSIASAARALQLMMALQDCGTILKMTPDQETIDSARPVTTFEAELIPSVPVETIFKSLSMVGDIQRLRVGALETGIAGQPVKAAPLPGKTTAGDEVPAKLVTVHPEPESRRQSDDDGHVASKGANQPVPPASPATDPQPKIENPAGSAGPASKPKSAEKTIRTSVERLDILMNLVGEMITDRNRLNMIRANLMRRFRGDEEVDALSDTIGHVGLITDQMQAEVMGIRMLPIANVFNKFPRLVRDLSNKAGKQIDLVLKGEETELDRAVIEEISDPLIHLLRNAADHGVETPAERLAAGKPERGQIVLSASHEQGHILITVEDNGRGIDVERVKNKAVEKGLISRAEADGFSNEDSIDLIFMPGLSTARVVSDVSGRGVGMDIVRNNIERLNGSIQVETWPGKGTLFQIVLPLTLAIVPTLLVKVAKGTYAIPLVAIREILRVPQREIKTVNRRPVVTLRESVLPVIRLGDVFKIKNSRNGGPPASHEYIVVINSGKMQLGLIVDALVGEEEVVVKSLSTVIGDVSGVSSAAILGDGQVALILDTQGIFKLAAIYQHTV